MQKVKINDRIKEVEKVPIISQFYGITVKIYFEEGDRHHTEHIHINYNEYEARHNNTDCINDIDTDIYSDITKWQTECKQLVLEAIEKEKQSHE